MKDISRFREQIEGKKRPLYKIKQLIVQYPIASIVLGLLIIILIIWGILGLISAVTGDNPAMVSDNQSSQNPPVDNPVYPEISGITVNDISESAATIKWTTDIPSTGRLEYWTFSSDNCTGIDDTELTLEHSLTLTGLAPETTYYFTITSTSGSGGKSISETGNQFTTTSGIVTVSPEVGYQAPDFALPDLHDNMVNLSDYRGKWLIICFWETDCSACRATLPHLQKYYETMPRDKIDLISINYKERDKIILISLIQNRGVTYPVLLDSNGAIKDEYKITGFPTLFLIDEEGIIQKVVMRKFDNKEDIEQVVNSVADF
jgi:peroxiredoxin